MKNKRAKQMICDVMEKYNAQRFCFCADLILAEYDSPICFTDTCWLEFETGKPVSLTANQLRGIELNGKSRN